jgi:class 3 adenylate cyclase
MGRTLVGRDRERAVLASAVQDAVAGRGTLVHIVGEPGIGKTALAEAGVDLARAAGMATAWGRAVEGAPAFWPWRRAVEPWPAEGDGFDRFELFESIVASMAERASASGGLLVVLDDLHWTDDASLRLLEHVVGAVREHALLLVVTSRRAEAAAGTTLADIAATLARHGTVIELAGLEVDEIAEVARAETGRPVDAGAATAIAELTAGNPFFVQQVAHLVAHAGGELGRFDVPAGVDAVVRQRVRVLGAEAGEALDAAAVLGRAFDVEALTVIVGSAVDVGKVIEGAVGAGLLSVDVSRLDRLRFVHAIVRDALHEALPTGRRAELHRRALEHLEGLEGTAPSILAKHAAEAVSVVGREPAVRHGLAAARAALDATAFEDALRFVDVTMALDPADGARLGLLMVAGHAWFNLDDHMRSKASFLEAADRAEAMGDLGGTASALLAVGTGRLVGGTYSGLGPRIRQVLDELGDGHPGLRADLLSRLADFTVPVTERRALLTDAVVLARGAGDHEALGLALGRALLHGGSWMSMPERLAAADELREVARRVGTARLRLDGEAVATRVLLEAGDLDGASRIANALAVDPLVRSGSFELRAAPIVDTTIAVARGDLDRAEALFESMQAELARRGSNAGAATLTGQLVTLRREAGRGAELVPLLQAIRTLPDFADNLPAIDAALALLLVDVGDLSAARLAIDAALTHDLEAVAHNWAGNGVYGCGVLLEAMWLAGHAPPGAADRLRGLVEPVADRALVLAMLPMGICGWATFHVGLCALLDGRFDEAAPLLRESVDRHRAMRARPLLGRSLLALAEAEVGRLDGAAALVAAREAAEVLQTGSLAVVTERAKRLLSALGGAPDEAAPDAEHRTTTFVFTDIVGSTAHAAAAGDTAWIATLGAHTGVVRALAVRHGGRVVKGTGDGFMLAFPSALAGVRFALAARDATAGSDLTITAGVHTGEARQVDGDYLGHHVNVAARIAGAAQPGEVVVSDVVARMVEADTQVRLMDPRTVELKGLGPERVYPAQLADPA